MAWSSTTFKRSAQSGSFVSQDRVKQAFDKHRDSMQQVVEDAKRLKQDSQETVKRIVDPALKKSANR